MSTNTDIFKIESNHVKPSRGKVLIAQPFLSDKLFGRSVVLLVKHNNEGTMGLVMNKPVPLTLSQFFDGFICKKTIPVYWGGPRSMDSIFYLHTLENIPGALAIRKGLYVNGDFDVIKDYINTADSIEGKIRFFVGYAGWDGGQLKKEIAKDSLIISQESTKSLMDVNDTENLWQNALSKLGGKYEISLKSLLVQ